MAVTRKLSLALACALGALAGAVALGATDGASAAAADASAQAVGFLNEALTEATDAVTSRPVPAESLMLCEDADGPLLDAYVARLLAAHLGARGWKEARFTARLPGDSGKPRPLPLPVLKALRNASARTFVHAAAPLKAAERCLAVDVYDVGSGAVLSSVRLPFRLTQDQAGLVTRERQPMSAADADWLTLFEAAFGPPAAGTSSGPSEVDVAEAQFLLDAGLWDVAARHFLALAPAGPNACFMRGAFALQLAGRADEAVRLAESARRNHPENGPLCALLAWLNLRNGREDNAVLLLETARLSDMTREGLYRYAEGLMALESGNNEVAEAKLSRAAALLPDAAFVQLRLARFYLNRGRLAQSVAAYRRGLAIGTPKAKTWAELALALRAMGDEDGALDALRRAFVIRTDNVGINSQLATVLKLKGRYKEALDALRKAAEANPHAPAVLAAYGDAAMQMWRIDDARQAFQDAVALDDDFPYAAVRLAAVLAVQLQQRQAREMLEDLLARKPDYAPARVELGALLGKMGLFDQAVDVLQATAVAPKYEADARLALSEVYEAAGNASEAVAAAQIAASSRPDAGTYAALSRAYLAKGEIAKAENAARTAVEQDDRSDAAHLALALVLQKKEQPEEADRETALAVKINPYSVDALVAAGRLANDRGDARACVEFWRRALALDPWNAELHHDLGVVLGRGLGDWDAAREHVVKWAQLEEMRTGVAPQRPQE